MIYWNFTRISNLTQKEQSVRVRSRKQSSLAHKAILKLLAQVTKEDHWEIKKDPKGKPYPIAPDGTIGPHISLSHSKEMLAWAVSTDGPIGIDVEYNKERDFLALATYAYGPKEQKYIKDNGMDAFYKVWVVRESCAKSAGRSILSTLDHHDLLTDFENAPYWSTHKWSCFYTKIDADYSLAIATPVQEKWDQESTTKIS